MPIYHRITAHWCSTTGNDVNAMECCMTIGCLVMKRHGLICKNRMDTLNMLDISLKIPVTFLEILCKSVLV